MAGLAVGDTVMVPGDMHGVVKFIGPVAGKRGQFVGVQLASEYAPRGKNSGEVDGRFYFRTAIPGSGIFLPLEKAVKKPVGLGVRASPVPGTPTRLSSFNQGGRTPGLAKPNFSQSVGPGIRAGAASPSLKPPARRESLPRPSSPLRKVTTPTSKSLVTPKTRASGVGVAKAPGTGLGPPRAAQRPAYPFGQSLRQSISTQSQASGSPTLGPDASFDDAGFGEADAESTPTPTPQATKPGDAARYELRVRELTKERDDARQQLREQEANFGEMERSFTELQRLLPALEEEREQHRGAEDDEDLPRDVASLREVVREKNEKIKLLTAEFDANRADFRSTIDTLEMASTETERVYEKRVDELLEEVRTLQDRSEDVEAVAQQLKQLEELVQELEEGLEDARRGEAEARGEVEFLRGEVERSKSELRRERERLKTEEQLSGHSPSNVQELEAQLQAKDDEIRGLKAIVQNLNRSPDPSAKANGIPASNGHHRHGSLEDGDGQAHMQQQICDLEALLQEKNAHQEELVHEVQQLRNSVTLSKFPMPGSAFGIHTAMRPASALSPDASEQLDRKHMSARTSGSQRTVIGGGRHDRKHSQLEWDDYAPRGTSPVKHPERVRDTGAELGRDGDPVDDSTTDISTSTTSLWCEICEEGGHDILTCANMFGPGKARPQDEERAAETGTGEPLATSRSNHDHGDGGDGDLSAAHQPVALRNRKSSDAPGSASTSARTLPLVTTASPQDPGLSKLEPAAVAPVLVEGTGAQAGMLAGRTTGVIDPEKWCALCERDGHDSVDCPLEDAF